MYSTTDQVPTPTPLPTPSAFAAHAAVFTPLLGIRWFKRKPDARKAAIVAVEKRWRWMRLRSSRGELISRWAQKIGMQITKVDIFRVARKQIRHRDPAS